MNDRDFVRKAMDSTISLFLLLHYPRLGVTSSKVSHRNIGRGFWGGGQCGAHHRILGASFV